MNELSMATMRLWAEDVKACKESGLSAKAWCKTVGIPPSTYAYRVKRLKETALTIHEQTDMFPECKQELDFVKLPCAEPDTQKQIYSETTGLKVSRGNLTIELTSVLSADALTLLREMLDLC